MESVNRDSMHMPLIYMGVTRVAEEMKRKISICIHVHMYICSCCLVAQSCLTVCDPMDCSPPGSYGHGVFQARILEWVTIFPPSSPECLLHYRWILFFTTEPLGKPICIYIKTCLYIYIYFNVYAGKEREREFI